MAADQLGGGLCFLRLAVFGLLQVVEDRAQVAVETGGARLRVGGVALVVLLERVVDAAHVVVELGRRHERLAE